MASSAVVATFSMSVLVVPVDGGLAPLYLDGYEMVMKIVIVIYVSKFTHVEE